LSQNLEIKAPYPDLGLARARSLDLGARPAAILHQRDTYFCCPAGRLKLRAIEGETTQLIWYDRPTESGTRLCSYAIAPVPDADLMRALLSSALGTRGDVVKRRELLLWHNVRIHLDQVAGLGSFVEFEAVLGPDGDHATSVDRIQQLMAALGMHETGTLAGSYLDLTERRQA
jgi:adenylate cyclase class IV